MMYHVYLQGSSNPVWSYKTWVWTQKRLESLRRLQSIKTCRIEVENFGKVTELGIVEFSRYGWGIDWDKVKK